MHFIRVVNLARCVNRTFTHQWHTSSAMNHFVSRTYRRSLYHVCSHEATCVLELLLGLSRTAVHLHIYGTLRVSHCSSVSRRGSSYHHRPRPAYRWPPTRLPRLFTKKRKSPRSARSALHKNSLRKHTRTSAEPRARGIFSLRNLKMCPQMTV